MKLPLVLPSAAFVVALSGGVLAGAAHAQVIEIDGSGSVTVYDRPGVFTEAGRAPLFSERASPTRASAGARSLRAPPTDVARHIADAAAAYSVEPKLLESVAWRESGFAQGARSSKGAAGVMQLMPGTARDLGVDASDARQNIFGGAYYLKTQLLRFGGDVSLALAAYNAGPGAVLRYRGVPPFAETRAYVAAITGRLNQTSLSIAAPAAAAVLKD